jgi:hypothetical protein
MWALGRLSGWMSNGTECCSYLRGEHLDATERAGDGKSNAGDDRSTPDWSKCHHIECGHDVVLA